MKNCLKWIFLYVVAALAACIVLTGFADRASAIGLKGRHSTLGSHGSRNIYGVRGGRGSLRRGSLYGHDGVQLGHNYFGSFLHQQLSIDRNQSSTKYQTPIEGYGRERNSEHTSLESPNSGYQSHDPSPQQFKNF